MTASRLRLLAAGSAATVALGALLVGIGAGIAAGSWAVGVLVALGLGLLAGGLLALVGAVLVSVRRVQRELSTASRRTAAVHKDVSRVMWRTEPVRATAGSISRVRQQLDLLLQPTTENKRRFAAVARGEVRRVLQRDPVDAREREAAAEALPTADLPGGAIGAVLGGAEALSPEDTRPFTVLTPEAGVLADGSTALVIDESALYAGPWADAEDGAARITELARAARAAEVPVLLLAVHGGEHPERGHLREQVDGIIDGSTWAREPGTAGGERIGQALAALAPLGVQLRD